MNSNMMLKSFNFLLAASLSAVLVAGCGGGGGGSGSQGNPTGAGAGTGVGGAGRGPAPVNLGTAGNFRILAQSNITDVSPSAITGDVGLSPATGAGIGLTCVEVTGAIQQKRRETLFVCAIKMLDQARRRGKAKLRPPFARVQH